VGIVSPYAPYGSRIQSSNNDDLNKLERIQTLQIFMSW